MKISFRLEIESLWAVFSNNFLFKVFLIVILGASSLTTFAQKNDNKSDTTKIKLKPYNSDRYGDPITNYFTPSPLFLDNPSNYKFEIDLDDSLRFYKLQEKLGEMDYRNPTLLPFEEYKNWRFQQEMRNYWKKLSLAKDGRDLLPKGDSIPLIPPIKLGRLAHRLFGGDKFELRTNGNLVLDFGALWNRVANPSLPLRQQRVGGFNFDQQIQMNLQGKIGQKLSINANFDTKNVFQFEQRYNLAYNAFEEEIIQDVQVGNLSFPVNNSLITGTQNLFGVSTKMRFGKLFINAVASSQRSNVETMVIRNGAASKELEIRADSYDFNRHFFLSQFFRNQYDRGMQSLPVINTGVMVTRVEVYITNRVNNTQTLRNVVSFLDMGEGDGLPHQKNKPDFYDPRKPVSNKASEANPLFEQLLNLSETDRLKENILRKLETSFNFVNGQDFELVQSARKLEPNEFDLHPQLGYITLRTPLTNDQVLAVAFRYTFNGVEYQVGEMTEDYANRPTDEVIFLKMIRPSTIRIDLPTWDLMMKNIYSLNTTQIQRENFQLRIIYRDDLSGLDLPNLQEGKNLANIPLVQVVGLDRLNPMNERQPDGNFDFLEGATVDSENARIIFPVVEPFGEHLSKQFDKNELSLREKFVFDTLYTGTQADAKLNTRENKYFIKIRYQAGANNEIILPGVNIAQNSVVITAGGVKLNEGTDFQVNYQFGRVKILNQGVLNSNKEIRIQFERADLFQFMTRNLVGFDMEYRLNKDIRFTSTLLHLNEKPIIRRVQIGNEPVKNTLWGFGMDYRSKSRLLTRILDALPLLSTKEESDVTLKAEFAQLNPGAPKQLGKDGTAFIDDFEGTELTYDHGQTVLEWNIGSTPDLIKKKFFDTTKPLTIHDKRARMAWYNIDQLFYYDQGVAQRPSNISAVDMDNHYVRAIPFNEIFPNRQAQQVNIPETTFDIAFYPQERGTYNLTTNVNPDGTLKNPEENFGAITKAIKTEIDFDNINAQYIEFWLLDPFIKGKNGQVAGQNNNTGGQLYFNLGNITEDLMPDNRHFFENGLGTTSIETTFGKVPTTQFLTNAFNASENRNLQDVGFDGLTNEEEIQKYAEFLNNLPTNLNAEIRQQLEKDPASDDFLYYLSGEADSKNYKVLERYKYFNNPQGNSPETSGNAQFNPSYTTIPDNEDLNRDNTLNVVEGYYQYKVDLKPNQLNNKHPYIVGQTVATYRTSTGQNESVTWYQFRIPIRQNYEKVGNIEGFKSIRFFRIFMTGWKQPVVLRMANLQIVAGQWRPYDLSLRGGSLGIPAEQGADRSGFAISSINIEENGQANGQNLVPYVIPPRFGRDYDATSTVTRQINEQSLQLCVEKLEDDDARAVFKNNPYDFLNYGRIKLEIHAHSRENATKDNELRAFMRFGTDLTDNYYEIEVPLKMTPIPAREDAEEIWKAENRIDVAFDELRNIKLERNKSGANKLLPFPAGDSPNVRQYRIRIVGNPDMTTVMTMMLGIRNPKSRDGASKQVCVWFDELRVTDFDTKAGWATNISLNTQLADFATVTTSLRHNTVGFGGIQDKVSERTRSSTTHFDISSNINLEKLGLNRLGITMPLFVSYERRTTTPQWDPLDPDMPLDMSSQYKQEGYKELAQEIYQARSINIANLKKQKMNPEAKPHFWDIENISLRAAYSDNFTRNSNTESLVNRQWKTGATYAFQSQAQPLEPFKNVEWMNSPYLKFLKDFNLNYLPNSMAIRADLNRNYRKTQYRNNDLTTSGILPNYEKSFTFDRGYDLQWNFTQNLKFDYSSIVNAIIDEPAGEINEIAKDSIMSNLKKLGRTKLFQQKANFNYTLPFDKFPITNWIVADLRYSADFNWKAATLGQEKEFGNTIQNNRMMAFAGKIDFTKIYNKIPFIQKMNQASNTKNTQRERVRPGSNAQQPNVEGDNGTDLLEIKKKRLDEKRIRLRRKLEDRQMKKKLEEEERLARIKIEQLRVDSLRRLLPDSLKNTVKDVKIEEKTHTTEDTVKKPSRLERRIARLEAKIAKIQAKQDKRKEESKDKTSQNKGVQAIVKTVTMVKDVNFTVSDNGATILPGFLPQVSYLGFDNNFNAPGLPFLLGSQNPNIRQKASEGGWLVNNSNFNNPFQQNRSKELSIQANVEPFKDFKLQLKAIRRSQANYTETFRFDSLSNDYKTFTPIRTGNYSITFFALPTTFDGAFGKGISSSAFDNFIKNREYFRNKLNQRISDELYQLNSQDVLIPSFIAAYSGKDVSKVKTSAFPQIPIPNWSIQYTGLGNVANLKDIFKSVSLTHAYNSEFGIGSYTSSSAIYADFITIDRNENDIPTANQTKEENGQVLPIYVIQQVQIRESFAPFLGLNMKFQNDFQLNIDYKKERALALNLSNTQITEQRRNGITISASFRKAGMRLPFRFQGETIVLKNEVNFNLAFSINDDRIIQRKIDEPSIITQGQTLIQFKPTITYAINRRANLQMYFERNINNPKVSNQFLNTKTAFGIQFRYGLTQ
ncbi:MAG: cell surface protein SprA [Flammeovirgaceae bacterium]